MGKVMVTQQENPTCCGESNIFASWAASALRLLIEAEDPSLKVMTSDTSNGQRHQVGGAWVDWCEEGISDFLGTILLHLITRRGRGWGRGDARKASACRGERRH